MRVFLCVVMCCLFAAEAGKLPSFMKACSASDPNLNQCIENVISTAGPLFAKGIPELGIASLDPVDLGKVVANNPALKITFTDTVLTGLGGFRLNSYKIDLQKQQGLLDFTANVTLKGHYDMDGQVLILPIRGNGDARIKITNLNIIIKYDYKTVDGYWTVPSYTDSFKMDHAYFKFTNLFGGNKDLADLTLKFINENWETIMNEVAPPAIKSIVKSCVNEVKELFSKVPADELLLQ